jgi:hypothetical protein
MPQRRAATRRTASRHSFGGDRLGQAALTTLKSLLECWIGSLPQTSAANASDVGWQQAVQTVSGLHTDANVIHSSIQPTDLHSQSRGVRLFNRRGDRRQIRGGGNRAEVFGLIQDGVEPPADGFRMRFRERQLVDRS